ncbi:MAG TPA: OsmC family protein [Candidatus Angelobacter sp.]|nr:OsmC family protein [Candidatus Angelobacter sp.]
MSNTKIRDALAQASAYLTAHPNEARYTDSPATAVLESGLAVTVQGPNGASVGTDMPKSVGGRDGAPSPGWLLRAAQASCLATLIAMRAAQQGIELGRIEVVVDSESDDRGILGLDDSVPAGPLSSRARVRIGSKDLTAGQFNAIIRWAEVHCPVQDAVKRAVPSTVEATETI